MPCPGFRKPSTACSRKLPRRSRSSLLPELPATAVTEYLRSVQDPRLRIIEQKNPGLTAALNQLIEEAGTPWLARMDADDVSYPARIATLRTAIEAHPEAGLLYSLADYHPRDRCAGRFRCSRGSTDELRALVNHGYLLSFCHSTVLLNIEKVRAVGGYRRDIRAEDADLWWRMVQKFEIHCIPEVLVGFRQHADSLSAEDTAKQELAGLYVQYLLLSELWRLQPLAYSKVERELADLLRPAAVKAKERLRQFNMHLAQRQRALGLWELASAVRASPGYVLRRVRDEFRPKAIANGIPPSLFWERKDVLWA